MTNCPPANRIRNGFHLIALAVTVFGLTGLNRTAGAAQIKCGPLLLTQGESATAVTEIQSIQERVESIQRDFPNGINADQDADRARTRFKAVITSSLENVRSFSEYIHFLEQLAKLPLIIMPLNQAINSVDLLNPVRRGMANREQLNDLQRLLLKVPQRSHWPAVANALTLARDPTRAATEVTRLVKVQFELSVDFFTRGAEINQSVIQSLAHLPDAVKARCMEILAKAIRDTESSLRTNPPQDDWSRRFAMLPRRNAQLIRTIFLRPKFEETVRRLNEIYIHDGVSKEFISTLEKYLALANWSPARGAYSLRRVFQVAGELEKSLRDEFAQDSAIIYGSFPNLLGGPTSDVDVQFRGTFQEDYNRYIRGPEGGTWDAPYYTTAGLTTLEMEKAQRYVKKFLDVESRLSAASGIKANPGSLLSLSSHPDYMSSRDYLAYVTLYSPITFSVSKEVLELRIFDTLQSTPGDEPTTLNFPLPLPQR